MGREADWIAWTSTQLDPSETEAERKSLTAEEQARLEDAAWVWRPGKVLWLDPSRSLRRSRFTHGTYIRTAKDELYIDSTGRARRVPQPRPGARRQP